MTSDASRRWAAFAASRPPWFLAAVTATIALAALLPFPHATSWHFFHDAAHALFDTSRLGDGGGLDLYREHPEFQFGPLTILIVAPLAYLPAPVSAIAAMTTGSLLGVATVALLYDIIERARQSTRHTSARATALGVVTLTAVWSDIAVRTAHLDDAIALAAATGAVAAIVRRRPWLAVTLLAVAAAAKPWAIIFAPLALVPPGRQQLRRLVTLGGLVLLGWLPFIIDEPATVRAAGSFKITNAASSALRALGVTDPATPAWLRPTQIGLGLLAAAVLVRTGRWHAVIMATIAIRLVLDPGVHHYYTAGLVAGVLLWESLARPDRLPIVTMLAAVICELTSGTPTPAAAAGAARLMVLIALLVAATTTRPVRGPRSPIPRATWPRAPKGRQPSPPGDRHATPRVLPTSKAYP